VINMTRCNLLDSWFDNESTKLDKVENNYGRCLITGNKKKTTLMTKAQAWAKVFRRNKE
tara:strand:- start:22483 stop:22659 length:177 start_codon:yes stop_codon:yes gene_type:complete